MFPQQVRNRNSRSVSFCSAGGELLVRARTVDDEKSRLQNAGRQRSGHSASNSDMDSRSRLERGLTRTDRRLRAQHRSSIWRTDLNGVADREFAQGAGRSRGEIRWGRPRAPGLRRACNRTSQALVKMGGNIFLGGSDQLSWCHLREILNEACSSGLTATGSDKGG